MNKLVFGLTILVVLLVPGTQGFAEDDSDPFNIRQSDTWIPKWSKGGDMLDIHEYGIPEHKVPPLEIEPFYRPERRPYGSFYYEPLLDVYIIERLSEGDLDTFEFLILLDMLNR